MIINRCRAPDDARFCRDESACSVMRNIQNVYDVYKDADVFEDHIRNEPVKKFNEIMNSLIEGWTMVIPFGG